MLWIGFNWLLISYVITYGCAEMLSDVLDAFDYSFWQLGLKTAGRHFLICNGLPWRANKTRWLDEWSCSAHPVLLRCSAILKANTMRASQGKSGKNFKEHEDLVLPEVPCCQHQGRVSQGTGTWAQTKQKCPSVSDPRRGRSDYIAGDKPPACQPQGLPCVILSRPAHRNPITTALCTQPANGPPGTCFSLRAHLGMPEPTL